MHRLVHTKQHIVQPTPFLLVNGCLYVLNGYLRSWLKEIVVDLIGADIAVPTIQTGTEGLFHSSEQAALIIICGMNAL